jgi:plastocyanin
MNGLQYTPDSVSANIGDIVEFMFYPKNHTVTQSTFAAPCTRAVSPQGQEGIDSGFMPVAPGTTTNNPTFAINVTTTSPLWFYCRQTGHCAQGMVFAVNPNPAAGKGIQQFQAAAIASGGATTSTSGGTPGTTTTGSTTGSTTGDTTGETTGNSTTDGSTDGSNPGGIDPATGEPTSESGATPTDTTGDGSTTGTTGATTPTPTVPNSAASLKVGNAIVIIAALAAGLML